MKKQQTELPKIVTAFELQKQEIELKKKQWKLKVKNQQFSLTYFQKEVCRKAVIMGSVTIKDFDNYYTDRYISAGTLRRLLDLKIMEEVEKKKYIVNKKFADSLVIWGN